MSSPKVYVFAGKFENRDEACLYSQPQWEPEPEETVSDEEYAEWEDRNPIHKLKDSICQYLDEDFIETVDLSFSYLTGIGVLESKIDEIRMKVGDANYFVLVYRQAMYGDESGIKPISNATLKFCGVYDCSI